MAALTNDSCASNIRMTVQLVNKDDRLMFSCQTYAEAICHSKDTSTES